MRRLVKDTNPSQIFLTLVLSWSPWKNIRNTDLYTSAPCKWHHVTALLTSLKAFHFLQDCRKKTNHSDSRLTSPYINYQNQLFSLYSYYSYFLIIIVMFYLLTLKIIQNIYVDTVWHTVTGSSSGASMSVCLRSTLPRQARHNIRSNAASRSRRITPATNLRTYNTILTLS